MTDEKLLPATRIVEIIKDAVKKCVDEKDVKIKVEAAFPPKTKVVLAEERGSCQWRVVVLLPGGARHEAICDRY